MLDKCTSVYCTSIQQCLSREDSNCSRALQCAGLCSTKTDLPHLSLCWRFEGQTNDTELVLRAVNNLEKNAVLTSRPAGFQISCANVERGTGHRRALTDTVVHSIYKDSRRSLCIKIHTKKWKLQSEDNPENKNFMRYSYSRVNYNYERFNLALNRKQGFCLRYVNV